MTLVHPHEAGSILAIGPASNFYRPRDRYQTRREPYSVTHLKPASKQVWTSAKETSALAHGLEHEVVNFDGHTLLEHANADQQSRLSAT